MPEGIITKLFDKGFGFIQAVDGSDEHFFHMSYLAPEHAFAALQKGDSVTFRLRPSSRKPGQQEAFDIEPMQGASAIPAAVKAARPAAGRVTSPAAALHDGASAHATLPYGFVPIDIKRAVADEPVWHNGSSGGDLLSGEILCELEALTPLLPGNMRYPVDQAKEKLKTWDGRSVPGNKQIAEPLRLPDGRVVIAGTSLKGMIRQSLSALTSAPMERVGERHFTYRPNLHFNQGVKERYVARPALVLAERDGGWDIEVFDDARSAQFVRHGQEPPPATTHRCVSYKGGIDGEGLLAQAFNPLSRTYRDAFVPKKSGRQLHLPAALYERYLEDQRKILSDHKIGHLTAHPNSKNFDVDKVAVAIRQHAEFSPNQLIYVELTTGPDGEVTQDSKVVSCGHHFRYRWAYSSSIREQNGEPRACLRPHVDEQARTSDGAPTRLTGARLLFGYVRDDKNPIGQGVFERLAGRIAINHAVSVGVPCYLGDEKTGYCIPLKILGQPKPSAWEFYLRQPDDTKKPLKTYGDLPDDPGGELAGRKFYRHQKGTHEADIKADTDEIISSDQATLARFISQPGTRFRFAIRFARLRPWELGALLAVLEPHRLAPEGKPHDYAHKLGLGRPLGMGSVRISRSALRIRRENETAFLDDPALDTTLGEVMDTLRKKLDQGVVEDWLDAHRMAPNQRLGYPETKGGKGDWAIYNWHTTVRREYSQLRRQKSPVWSALAKKITREREADDPKSSST
jgi:CRISPR-associated protein (TIGR03986 family)